LDADEQVIGRAGNKDDEINIKSAQYSRFQCTNCAKRKIHCIAGGKKGEPVQLLKDRCTNAECECRCRTHYIANNGRLKPYGTIDNTSAVDDIKVRPRDETDELIDKLNKKMKEVA